VAWEWEIGGKWVRETERKPNSVIRRMMEKRNRISSVLGAHQTHALKTIVHPKNVLRGILHKGSQMMSCFWTEPLLLMRSFIQKMKILSVYIFALMSCHSIPSFFYGAQKGSVGVQWGWFVSILQKKWSHSRLDEEMMTSFHCWASSI